MTFLQKRNKVVLGVALLAVFSGCTKIWDDHNQLTDKNLGMNLYQAISQTAGLGKFSDMLVKSGYDKIIASSKTYTVWAPNDQALQSLDPAILNDTTKLKQFVGNHISNQSYLTGALNPVQRIQMLNGKYNNATSTAFDSATIVTPNQYAANGVFHTINKFIPRYDNCWEFLKNSTAVPLMKSLLLSLNYIYFDSTKATQTGVDPNTGTPLWDSTNAKIVRNVFLDSAQDVSNEAGQYTLVLLTDAGYNTELNLLKPYFNYPIPDSVNKWAGFHLVKDFAFKGFYPPSSLPTIPVSKFGVHVPLNPANLVASYKTSNGIVYVMNDVPLVGFADKFPPIIIQGENPLFFVADRGANTFYRIRKDSLGNVFNDIYLQNYNYASYYIGYRARGIYSTKYNVSWVALNDVQTTPLWQQKLVMDSVSNPTSFPYVTVPYNRFAEVALGQWSSGTFYRSGMIMYVVGPTAASSTGGNNSISLDYIKLTPLP